MSKKIFYALDFDGVICDSAIETGMTGWKCARKLWKEMPEIMPPAILNDFVQARPVIETGYESILTVRLLYLQYRVEAICQNRNDYFSNLMQSTGISIAQLKLLFGQTRDAWIAEDVDDWINMNPLYAGIAEKLRVLSEICPWYVITTKQERFVKKILLANGIDCDDTAIFGLDRNLSKAQVLAYLLNQHPNQDCYFTEDRLATLIDIKKNPALQSVSLALALWGYNTAADKVSALEEGFLGISLDDFLVFEK